jgi:large subunit ribosomal protein L23
MNLSIYDIVKKPLLSEKAQDVNRELGKLVVEVHVKANKPMIKSALKSLFDVDAEKINIQVRKGKTRRISRGRITTKGNDRKIAYVTLKKGQSLDLFGHGGAQGVQESEPEKK